MRIIYLVVYFSPLVGVAQNYKARVTQVLVLVPFAKGTMLARVFEPQPCSSLSLNGWVMLGAWGNKLAYRQSWAVRPFAQTCLNHCNVKNHC